MSNCSFFRAVMSLTETSLSNKNNHAVNSFSLILVALLEYMDILFGFEGVDGFRSDWNHNCIGQTYSCGHGKR